MTPEVAAGWSALVAAAATVIGAVTLVLFFVRGQLLWGALNDASSVVLMLAMIPVALVVAAFESETVTTVVLPVVALGIGAMLVTAVLQTLLLARRVSFEQTKGWVLFLGAVVGVWYLLSGFLAGDTALEGPMAWLAIVSGVGFIAVGYGFAVGNERHPLSTIGGGVLLISSTAFLAALGTGLVSGGLVVPRWNV